MLCASILYSGCTCPKTVVQRVVSPDRSWSAIAYVRDCGATTWYITHLSIQKVDDDSLSEEGNTLVIDDANAKVPGLLDSKGAIPLTLEWRGDRQLMVRYPSRANILEKHSEVGPVTVRFEPIASR